MRLQSVSIGAALAVVAGMAMIASAQTAPATVDGLVSAAKVAAGTDWPGTFTRLCIPPPAAAIPAAAPAATAPRPGPPPREQWHAEPAKVADNTVVEDCAEAAKLRAAKK